MKKNLLSLLCTMLVVCSVNAQILKGDMNDDGVLTAADITTLVDHILKGKKEYASSDFDTSNNKIKGVWYFTLKDKIGFEDPTALYDGKIFPKFAYYPALSVILIYDSDGSVKHTLVVKEKTDTSMTLLLPTGVTKTYSTSVPPTLVESITLTTNETTLYTKSTSTDLPPESTTITASVLPNYADNKEVDWTIEQNVNAVSVDETTAGSITIHALTREGSAKITATATDGSGVSASIIIITKKRPSLEAVDLGTGVKWASMNVGAISPEELGPYYAWGEISAYGEAPSPYPSSFKGIKNNGYTSLETKTEYGWSTYKYCNGSQYTLTRYNHTTNYGTIDNITTLTQEDDAAHVKMGGDWRMPTQQEAQRLLNECYWQYVTSYNGKNIGGYIVYKAKNDADKGKVTNEKYAPTLAATYSVSDDTHIFLPMAGSYYMSEGSTKFESNASGYWLATEANSGYSYIIYMEPDTRFLPNYSRAFGCPIRAVCP